MTWKDGFVKGEQFGRFGFTVPHKKQYTHFMHIIDRRWTNLAAGYLAAQSLQARLDTEFDRAVQVGQRQKFRKEFTEWQKKRRIFFAFTAIAPLSILALCMAAFYFREVTCVIIYWAILVLIIFVALAVAGRNYIREVIIRPELESTGKLVVDLEQCWWASLSPKEQAVSIGKDQDKVDFLTLLASSLPNTCLARRSSPLGGANHVLLLASSGLWQFIIRDWSGIIIKQDGTWKQVRKRGEAVVYDQAPDDQWQQQKAVILNTLEKYLPQRTWNGDLIRGGVAFIHPEIHLEKARIQGSTAAYGPVRAWIERIRNTPPVGGFTPQLQLEILDALAAGENPESEVGVIPVSAKDEAWRLYQGAVRELRASVGKMVA